MELLEPYHSSSIQYNSQFEYNNQNYHTSYNHIYQSSPAPPQSQYYNITNQNYYPNPNGFLSPSNLSPASTNPNNYNNIADTNTLNCASYYNSTCPSNTTQFQNSFTSSTNNDSAYQSQIISPNAGTSFVDMNASKIVSTPVNVEGPLYKKRKRQSESSSDNVEQVSRIKLSPFSVKETTVEVKSKRPKVLKLNFTSSISMINGVATDSSETESSCPICNMSFYSAAKLLMHHHKIHKNGSSNECPICLKKFANPANAIVHLRAHTQEKIYKCHTCTQAFCDASTLKKHLRVHSGDRPFACTICAKGFTQSGNLKRHMILHQKDNVPTDGSSLENKINCCESQIKHEPTTQPAKHDFQFEHAIKNEYNFVNTHLIAEDHMKWENPQYTQSPSYLSQASQYHSNTSSYAYQASF